MMRKVLTIFLLLMTSLTCGAQVFTREVPQDMRTIFFCIVSSAENSSLDFKAQYAFIKDQGAIRFYQGYWRRTRIHGGRHRLHVGDGGYVGGC